MRVAIANYKGRVATVLMKYGDGPSIGIQKLENTSLVTVIATFNMYSEIKSIWAQSASYKINKRTETVHSHQTQLKQ